MVNNYTQLYDPSEVSEVSVDILMLVLIAIASLGTLVALILIFGWFKKHMPKI